MLLTGAKVVVPSGVLAPGWLRVAGGRIAAVGPGSPSVLVPGEERIELGGRTILPGFIDLHTHGGGGASYTDGDPHEVRKGRAFHLSRGTTRSFASLVTAPVDDLLSALSSLADLTESGLIAGAHLEGPFLSRSFRGAQDARYLLPPDMEVLERLLTAGRGTVRMVTVAPELPGATDLVRRVVEAGAIAAIGHSEATYATALSAIDAGASVATHLYNGMRPMHHRDPGIVGAALDREEVFCELIADGHHVHPAMLRLAFATARERVTLITDAIAAAGAPDGAYLLGSMWVQVEDGKAYVPGTQTIAGSTITMADAVRYGALQAGIPLPTLARAASATPARLLGLGDEVGTIETGKQADLVVLDAGLGVEAVVVGGEWAPRVETPVAP
jgi:N-acetylglucosamine-6-phosphate deacetylase